ncbi:hypothetical protein [Thalassospira sp. MCCC 1A01428]|uniref:hypothetical protein n=1 Tax=Thalassospira sp. MCCC 1A01428 TaxID=1470575 RepID=UPI000A1DDB14|nr:hypothetical protein [Thalassospira sp. MCCC 1A01428]OSQ39234.1 hypothetical protein THS27_21315 [Thalassospira sp. MCCC 1A01428]
MTNTSKCGLCTANIFTDAELAYQDIQDQATMRNYPNIIEQAMNIDANAYMHDLLDAFAIECEYVGDEPKTLPWLVTSYKMASLNQNHADCMAARAISYIDREWLHQIQSRPDTILPMHIKRIADIAKTALKKLSDDAFPEELKAAHQIQDCYAHRLAFTVQRNPDTGWINIASACDVTGAIRDQSALISPRLTKHHAKRLTNAINRCLGLRPLEASMIVTSAVWAREEKAA